ASQRHLRRLSHVRPVGGVTRSWSARRSSDGPGTRRRRVSRNTDALRKAPAGVRPSEARDVAMTDTRAHYDLVIIGGGQAGPPLAHAAANAGRRVALFERKQLGGSCVNFG